MDLKDILDARQPDFKLEPKDIVYVAARPWVKAEELTEVAIRSFVNAALVTYTGRNIQVIK